METLAEKADLNRKTIRRVIDGDNCSLKTMAKLHQLFPELNRYLKAREQGDWPGGTLGG